MKEAPQTPETTDGPSWLKRTLSKLLGNSGDGNVSIGRGNEVRGGSSSDNPNPGGPVVVKGNLQAGSGNKIEIN